MKMKLFSVVLALVIVAALGSEAEFEEVKPLDKSELVDAGLSRGNLARRNIILVNGSTTRASIISS